MKQMDLYQAAKERHPDMVLLLRVGDFFELYGADAETVAGILGLNLTQRTDRDTGEKHFMAGFPHQSLERYLHRLLKAGHRVAICEQTDLVPSKKAIANVQPSLFGDLEE